MSFMPDGMNLHRDRNLYFPQDQSALATYWNPLPSVAGFMAFSNGNRRADGQVGAVSNVAANSLRTHTRAAGGKFYSEFVGGGWTNGFSNSPPAYGLASADAGDGVNTLTSVYAFGFGGPNAGAFGFSGPVRPTIDPNDVVMYAVDFAAQKVWIGKNGVWVNGGDPALGTLPDGTVISAGTYRMAFIGLSLGTPTANINERARFNNGDFSFAVPTGFLPWGANVP